MRPIQPREHGLLILAMCAAVVVGYGLFRHRPASAKWTDLRGQIAEIEAALHSTDMPPERPGDPGRMRRRIARLETELASQRSRLRELQARFISVDAPRSVSAMRLAVSQLIEQCGATLASFEPIGSAEARAPGGGAPAGSLDAADREEGRDNRGDGAGGQAGGVMAEQASDDDAGLSGAGSLTEWLAGRPKQQLIVECDYDQLCRLTRGLGRLSWRVVVTDFEVETVTDQPGRPLRARLVLAY